MRTREEGGGEAKSRIRMDPKGIERKERNGRHAEIRRVKKKKNQDKN